MAHCVLKNIPMAEEAFLGTLRRCLSPYRARSSGSSEGFVLELLCAGEPLHQAVTGYTQCTAGS